MYQSWYSAAASCILVKLKGECELRWRQRAELRLFYRGRIFVVSDLCQCFCSDKYYIILIQWRIYTDSYWYFPKMRLRCSDPCYVFSRYIASCVVLINRWSHIPCLLRQVRETVLNVSTPHQQGLVVSRVCSKVLGYVLHWCTTTSNICFDNMRIR